MVIRNIKRKLGLFLVNLGGKWLFSGKSDFCFELNISILYSNMANNFRENYAINTRETIHYYKLTNYTEFYFINQKMHSRFYKMPPKRV